MATGLACWSGSYLVSGTDRPKIWKITFNFRSKRLLMLMPSSNGHQTNLFGTDLLSRTERLRRPYLAEQAASRGKEVKTAVCDRGSKTVGNTQIILPGSPLKQDSHYQRDQNVSAAATVRQSSRSSATWKPIWGWHGISLKEKRGSHQCLAGGNGVEFKAMVKGFLSFIFDCFNRFYKLSKYRTTQSMTVNVASCYATYWVVCKYLLIRLYIAPV